MFLKHSVSTWLASKVLARIPFLERFQLERRKDRILLLFGSPVCGRNHKPNNSHAALSSQPAADLAGASDCRCFIWPQAPPKGRRVHTCWAVSREGPREGLVSPGPATKGRSSARGPHIARPPAAPSNGPRVAEPLSTRRSRSHHPQGSPET